MCRHHMNITTARSDRLKISLDFRLQSLPLFTIFVQFINHLQLRVVTCRFERSSSRCTETARTLASSRQRPVVVVDRGVRNWVLVATNSFRWRWRRVACWERRGFPFLPSCSTPGRSWLWYWWLNPDTGRACGRRLTPGFPALLFHFTIWFVSRFVLQCVWLSLRSSTAHLFDY